VLIFCSLSSVSSVSSLPLGGGEVVRGRGRALPPNLLATHNYQNNYRVNSNQYPGKVLPQNLPPHIHYKADREKIPNKSSYPWDSNLFSNDEDGSEVNKELSQQKSQIGDGDFFSFKFPHFFEHDYKAQPSKISETIHWRPTALQTPRRRWGRKDEWEREKNSWTFGGSGTGGEGPPFGDILESLGERKLRGVDHHQEQERGGRGGWKPVSDEGPWSTTPEIWTNEVETPVITINNYKKYLGPGIGGHHYNKKSFQKSFEKVLTGSIQVSGGDHSSPHLIINRP